MDPFKKELWRLRFNWLFTVLMVPLYSVSQIGISSSFHQFVTNPTAEQIRNGTYKEVKTNLTACGAHGLASYTIYIIGNII